MTDITPLTDKAQEVAAEIDEIHTLLTGAEEETREFADQVAELHSRLRIAVGVLEAAPEQGPVSEIDLQDFDQRLAGIEADLIDVAEELSAASSVDTREEEARTPIRQAARQIETLRTEVEERISGSQSGAE